MGAGRIEDVANPATAGAIHPAPELAGQTRFEIREELGHGAMGVVYRAYDRARRIEVACKTLRRLDGDALYRFKNEFRSLAGIVHDNLVTLYELHSVGDVWFYSMELIDGVSFLEHVRPHARSLDAAGTDQATRTAVGRADRAGDTGATVSSHGPGASSLAAIIVRHQPALLDATLELARLRAALPQLAEGVHALHRAGRLHRDLKPSNVLVDRAGRVIVADFGLVAQVAARAAGATERGIVGTPIYMAPEQAAAGSASEASDWYSVGVMLYIALTGRLPFEGSLADIIERKKHEPPPPPRELAPDVPGDLHDLCVALLERDPARRPSGAEVLAALGHAAPHTTLTGAGADLRRSHPFVGRRRELAALRDALGASRGGRNVAALIHGPSGMGKSALVDTFLAEVERRTDAVVLRGRCYERESVPNKALDSIVDALAGFLTRLPRDQVAALVPPGIAALARMFPVLLRVDAIADAVPPVAATEDPHSLRQRALAALRAMLGALASVRATIVCIDDLQWGDVDSAAFLADLIRRPEPPAGLLIGCYRGDEAETSPLLRVLLGPRGLGGSDDVWDIPIGPLPEADAHALAVEAIGDSRGASLVAAEASGHPMFIAELARAAAGPTPLATVVSLDDVLRRRIATLPDGARALLTASSVAGRPLPVHLVGLASRIEDQAAALAVLQAEQLVRTRRVDDEDVLEPYHDRVRETVVSGLSEQDSRLVHRRLARALEATRYGDPLALVELWLGAHDLDKARRYALDAAELAQKVLAFDHAAHYYRVVLDLGHLEPRHRRAVLAQLGSTLASAGNLDGAARAYLDAADGAEHDEAVELRRRSLEQLLRAGRFDEGLQVTEQVLREVGLRLPRGRVRTLASIAMGRARVALRGLRFRPRPAEEIDPLLLQRVDVCWSVSSGLTFVDPMLGTAFQTRQLIYALRAGDCYRAAIALAMEVGFRSLAGTAARAKVERLASLAGEVAHASGDPAALGLVRACHGLGRTLMGEFRAGLELIVEGAELMRSNARDFRWQLDVAHNFELMSLIYLGRMRALIERVPELLRDAHDRGDEYLRSSLRSWRSNLAWLAMDQPDEARRQLAEEVEQHPLDADFKLPHYYRMLTGAQIELYNADPAAAWDRVSSSWRALEGSMVLRVQSVLIEAHYLRARCALAQAARGGDRAPLLADVERCARVLDRQDAAWAAAMACLARACATALRGADDAAVAELERARQQFEALDMALFAAVARYRQGRLLGGDEGAALANAATAWMQAEGIGCPERMVALLAPG